MGSDSRTWLWYTALLFFYLTMSLTILFRGLLTLLMSNSKYNEQMKITEQMLKGIATQDLFFLPSLTTLACREYIFKRIQCKIIIRYVKILLEMKEKCN